MMRTPRSLSPIFILLLAFVGCGDGSGGGDNDASFRLEGTFETSPSPSQNRGTSHFGLFDTSDGRLTARYIEVSRDGFVDTFTEEGSYEVHWGGTAGHLSNPGLFNMTIVASQVSAPTFLPLLWFDAHEIGSLEVYENRSLSDWNGLLTTRGRPIVELRISGDKLFYAYFDETESVQEEELTADAALELGIAHDWRADW